MADRPNGHRGVGPLRDDAGGTQASGVPAPAARQRAYRQYLTAVILADLGMLALAFAISTYVRLNLRLIQFDAAITPQRYLLVAVVLVPLLLLSFYMGGAYRRDDLLGGPEEYAHVAGGCTLVVLLVIAASFLYGSVPLVSRGWLLLFWVSSIVLVNAGRFAARRIAYAARSRGYFVRRVLIAGASDQGAAIAHQIIASADEGVKLVGFLDDYLGAGTRLDTTSVEGPRTSNGLAVLGHPRDLDRVLEQYGVDLLVVVPTAITWESQQLLAREAGLRLHDLDVRMAPTDYDLTAVTVVAAPLGYVPMVRLQQTRIVGFDHLVKGCVDRGLAALLLLLLLPLASVVTLAAWLRGVRPLFVQERVLGWRGRVVTLTLFNDQVTDRLLLHGLPALAAVLLGDLGLVGPQPVPFEQGNSLGRLAGVLLAVKPGVTGPWRLLSDEVPDRDRYLADVWWVRNWTVGQHLYVLFQTLKQTLRPRRRTEHRLARWRVRCTSLPGIPESSGPVAD